MRGERLAHPLFRQVHAFPLHQQIGEERRRSRGLCRLRARLRLAFGWRLGGAWRTTFRGSGCARTSGCTCGRICACGRTSTCTRGRICACGAEPHVTGRGERAAAAGIDQRQLFNLQRAFLVAHTRGLDTQALAVERGVTPHFGNSEVAFAVQRGRETLQRAFRQQVFARVELRNGEFEGPRQRLRLAERGIEPGRQRGTQAQIDRELLLLAGRDEISGVFHVADFPAKASGRASCVCAVRRQPVSQRNIRAVLADVCDEVNVAVW